MQCLTLASSLCRPVAVGRPRCLGGLQPAARPVAPAARRVTVAASSQPEDFDAFLETVANKFEKVDNKPLVVGWLVGAFSAIVIAEWFIHLPLFNVLLGFPIQFLGLIVTPYLALRYYVKREAEPLADAEFLVNKYKEQLPGFKK